MKIDPPSPQNYSGCLLRLYWMLFGNVIILASAAMLAKTGNIVLYGTAFMILLASLLAARYADIRFCNGYKADDSGPATRDDLRKYVVITISIYMFILIAIIALKSN